MTILDPTRPGAPARERAVYKLPREAYFDREWYARERALVFSRTWSFVGHESDFSETGDFVTAEVGDDPVLVVRNEQGELRGYLNICRHRGMVVECEAAGSCGESIRCMYHGWEWDLDGSLTRVPQRKTQFADLDVDEHGLHPVAVDTWAGFVFVHLDPAEAGNLRAWLGTFPDHVGDYPWARLVEVGRDRFPVAANWKLFIENHIDWLHLWYLHEESIAGFDHHASEHETEGLHWWSRESLRPGEPMLLTEALPQIDGVSDEETRTVRAGLVFPNLAFSPTGASVALLRPIPTGPESCDLETRFYALPGSSLDDDSRAFFRQISETEDARACERMQQAMHSSRFRVGTIASEFEAAISAFHDNLLTYLGSAR